jgi:hypothetical protein
MQEIAAAAIVAVACALLAAKAWRAIRRRCRPQGDRGCDKCCKCG